MSITVVLSGEPDSVLRRWIDSLDGDVNEVTLRPGSQFRVEDHVALQFDGQKFVRIVSSSPTARAWRGDVPLVPLHLGPPQVSAILDALLDRKVEFVLTGSVAAACYGVPLTPRDLDIAPDLSDRNFERIAGLLADWKAKPVYSPGWDQSLTPEQIEAWEPSPPTPAHLDHLFSTPKGMLDVVPKISGQYQRIIDKAHTVDGVRVAHPQHLIDFLRPDKAPKHVARQPQLERVLAQELTPSLTGFR